MKSDYTHISLVLDRSGSMSSVRDDTIGGVNRFLDDQKAAPGKATFTLVAFNSNGIDTLLDAKPIAEAQPLTQRSYVPDGYTPLYDAIGKTIVATGDHLMRLPESERPAKVVFVVMTDGMENHSQKFNMAQVQDMIKHQREVYKWEFVFMGANIDSYAVGGSVGVSASNTMNYASNPAGVAAAYASLSSNTVKLRCGSKSHMDFEPEDLKAQADAGATQ